MLKECLGKCVFYFFLIFEVQSILPVSKQRQEVSQQEINGVTYCNLDNYKQHRVIASGAEGEVVLLEREDGNLFAMKRRKGIFKGYSTIPQEIKVLTRIRDLQVGPQLVCVDKNEDFFIMEFVDGIPLHHIDLEFLYLQNKKSPEKQTDIFHLKKSCLSKIAPQMFSTISKLHQHNVYHLDAHTDNWIYDPHTGKITLIDFGGSQYTPDIDTETHIQYVNQDAKKTAKTLLTFWDHIGENMSSLSTHFPVYSDILLKLASITIFKPIRDLNLNDIITSFTSS